MTLTAKELEDKIAMVESDINTMRAQPGNDRKISSLLDYIDYLKDELKESKRDNPT